MSKIRNTDTKVYLYKNDYNRVCEEIYRHPNIETGGNLLGLWTAEGNIVVHAALGPGKNCKRTDVSFHQDIEYMSRVGTFLNQKFMLCHIGEWHSHHHLSLNKPSSGDNRTIRQNYPNGVKKFLVIIGNIIGNDQVILSPYFFSENGDTCEKGEFKVLDVDSPFTTDSIIAKEMNERAETSNHPYCSSSSPNEDQQQSASEGSSGANGRSQPSAMDISSNSSNQSPGTVPQNVASGSYANAVKAKSGVPADKNLSDLPIVYPPPDYETSPPSQPTLKSLSEQTTTATPQNSVEPPPASNDLSTTSSSAASPSQAKSDDNNKQTRQEVILKKVFDGIKSILGDPVIDIERFSSSDVEMRFKHNNKHWFIRFPQSFPEKPAAIFSSYLETFSSATQCSYRWRDFLNNHINILLAIKNECRSFAQYCTSCRKLDVQSLAQFESSVDLFLTEEGNAMIEQLWKGKAKDTLADTGSLKKEIKCDNIYENATLEVNFTHALNCWKIKVSSTFPSSPAKLYYKDAIHHFGNYSMLYTSYLSSQSSSKNWAAVLLAIANTCKCEICKRL